MRCLQPLYAGACKKLNKQVLMDEAKQHLTLVLLCLSAESNHGCQARDLEVRIARFERAQRQACFNVCKQFILIGLT